MAGIWSGTGFPGFFYPVLVLIAGLGIATVVHIRRGRSILLLPLLICLCAGYASIQPWVRTDLPVRHVVNFADHGKWTIYGTIIEGPTSVADRHHFVLDARRLQQDGEPVAVCGRTRITTRGNLPALKKGDGIRLSGHLHGIRSFCNPGGFDYERYMALKGIRTRLFAAAETITVVHSSTFGYRRYLEVLRGRVSTAMDAALAGRPHECAAVLKALTIGDRSGIEPPLQAAFNRAGVAHILAISGLHVGMVAAAAFAVGVWTASWWPFLLLRGWTRKAAALFTLAVVGAYGMLSGWSPATQRAVLMTAVVLAGFWIGRRPNWPNTLAAAAVAILLVFPPGLFSVSFQLSFAAVATIAAGGRWFSTARPTAKRPLWQKGLRRARDMIGISILAIAGTLPLVCIYFDQISWVGPFTNLFIIPLTGVVIIPAGLLGVVFLPLSPTAAGLFWQISDWCLQPAIAGIKTVAACPWTALEAVVPNRGEVIVFYLLLFLLLTFRRWPKRPAAAALVALLLIAAVDVLYWVYERYGGGTLKVTVLDVGQGSANLLQLPGGYTALIDGGGYADNATFDVGRSVVAPLLRRKKIRTIDLVVLSHPDSDHLNGLLYLMAHFSIGEIWSNHEAADTDGYRRWQTTIVYNHIAHPPFTGLVRHRMIHGVQFDILSPPKEFSRLREAEPWRNLNNDSLVLRVAMGGISMIFTGDIMARGETDLLSRVAGSQLRSTVLIVPHHGSRRSNSMAFLKAVDPAVAVISAGWHNRFGFPHPEILNRLARRHSAVWRTDRNGAVRIDSDGLTLCVRGCRSAYAE